MSHVSRTVGLLAAVVAAAALGACTQDGPAIPDTPVTSSSSPTTTPTKPDYPLSIQRLGLSGSDRGQRLSIQEDRTVLATGADEGQQVTCSLAPDAFTKLSAAALDIARSSEGGDAPATDPLLFQGVGASDPRVAPVTSLVTRLLADVDKPQGQRTLCR